MPSLLGTYIASNYGRMTSIDTYGGLTYNNFGTRNLAFLKVIVTGTLDLTTASGDQSTDASNVSGFNNQITSFNPITNNQTPSVLAFEDSNSYFSVAVRTIQQFAEIYLVGTPYYDGSSASSFIVAVSLDTANDANASSNTQIYNTGYPTLGGSNAWVAMANQIKTAVNSQATLNTTTGSSTVTVGSTVSAVTVAQIFPYGNSFVAVGGSLPGSLIA